MSSATKDELNLLHSIVAGELKAQLNDPDVEVRTKALNQAIKFLKDNHIEANSGEGTPLEELEEAVNVLPFASNNT